MGRGFQLGRRLPTDGDPGLLRWFVDEMGNADAAVLVAMFEWVSEFTVVPISDRRRFTHPQTGTTKQPPKSTNQPVLLSRYHAIQRSRDLCVAGTTFRAQHDADLP